MGEKDRLGGEEGLGGKEMWYGLAWLGKVLV